MRDLPERYEPWKTCHERLRRWTDDGTWDKILAGRRSLTTVSRSNGSSAWTPLSCERISTPLAHAKGGSAGGVAVAARDGEALGRSRGGLSTKIHLAVDGRGRPLSVLLTAGQAGDNPPLLALPWNAASTG